MGTATILHALSRSLRWPRSAPTPVPITWIQRQGTSWLSRQYGDGPIAPARVAWTRRIEALAARANRHGALPLWEGYPAQTRRRRLANDVRTTETMGQVFVDLVRAKRPATIVEFGTAFGVSGMYWLAGLEANAHGHLFTFEPNLLWADIAERNLARVSRRFTLVKGTFEQNVDQYLARVRIIDLAFIDAIHTREFVMPQLELVLERCAPGALIVLDDINFSDDMRACWEDIARDVRLVASAALGPRVGIVELYGEANAQGIARPGAHPV
jgi:predicted O-methyltransferase YrrM